MMTSIKPSEFEGEEAMEVDEDQVEIEATDSTGVDEEEARKIGEADADADTEDFDYESHDQKQEKELDPRIAKEFDKLRKLLPKTVLINDDDILEWTQGSLSETDNEIKALNEHALNTPLIDLKSMKSVQQEINLNYRKKIIGGKYTRNYNGEVIGKLESELDISKIYELNENSLGLTDKKYLNAPFLVNFDELYNETYGRDSSAFLDGDVIDDDLYENENRPSTSTNTASAEIETEKNNIDQNNSTNQLDEAVTIESNNKEVETLIIEEVEQVPVEPSINISEEQESKNAASDEGLVDVIEGDDDEESEEEGERPLIRISSSIFENPNADSDNTFSNNLHTTSKNVPDLIPIPTSSTSRSEGATPSFGRNKIGSMTTANETAASNQQSASQQFRIINTTNASSTHSFQNKIFSINTPNGIVNLRPRFVGTTGALQGQIQLQKFAQTQPRLSTGFSNIRASSNQIAAKETSSNVAKEGTNSRTKILSQEFYRYLVSISGNTSVTVPSHEYLSCHLCGVTFPFTQDHKYRNHLLVKHQLNVDTQEALITKIKAGVWYKCRICSVVIMNNLIIHESNHLLSERSAFRDGCFEKVITSDILHKKIKCGNCDSFFYNRRLFRKHLETNHTDLLKYILLEPDIRCAVCLRKFDDTSILTKHVASCSISGNIPSPETVLEFAKNVRNCGVCETKHKTIEETQKCYSKAQLLRCLFCLQTTNSRDNFIAHMRLIHGNSDGTSYSCPFCKEDTTIKDSFLHCKNVHYYPALKEYHLKHTSPTGSLTGSPTKFKQQQQLKPTDANQASESPIMRPAGTGMQTKIIRIQSSAFRAGAPFTGAPGQKIIRQIFVNKSALPKNYALYPISSMPTTSTSSGSGSPASASQGGQGQGANKLIPVMTNSSGAPQFKVITSSEATRQIIKNIQVNDSTSSSSTVQQRPIFSNTISQNEKEIAASQITSTAVPTTSKNATIAALDSTSTSTESRQTTEGHEEVDDDEDDDEILVGL